MDNLINYFDKYVISDSLKKPLPIDYFSILHILSGFISYVILHKYLKISIFKSFILFNIIHFIYEAKDYYYSYIKNYNRNRPTTSEDIFNLGYHANNSYINSIGDLLVGCLGFFLGYLYLK